MTKTFFHRTTGKPAVFDNDANIADWPDFQEYPLPAEVTQLSVLQTRQGALALTDWYATTDRTMTQEQIDYRQALRDITKQTAFIEERYDDIEWPVRPNPPGLGLG